MQQRQRIGWIQVAAASEGEEVGLGASVKAGEKGLAEKSHELLHIVAGINTSHRDGIEKDSTEQAETHG